MPLLQDLLQLWSFIAEMWEHEPEGRTTAACMADRLRRLRKTMDPFGFDIRLLKLLFLCVASLMPLRCVSGGGYASRTKNNDKMCTLTPYADQLRAFMPLSIRPGVNYGDSLPWSFYA
ncbi:unnamed protein product [Nippostrongylus brasiliensis]|uniref:Uncharacterized protein n=1 Tax=Nippostrongylus brasiliensis TaxID=27835 RepID=A0A0N4XR55_NIPBR|nr:unnamed protein product [Nippostrongylus brasiliensis]